MKKHAFLLSIILAFSLKSMAIDLTIGRCSVNPTTVAAGATFSATCSVVNTGGGTPGGTWVNYYLSTNTTLGSSDVLLGSSVGFTTYPYTLTTSLSTLCTVTSGTYYIIFQVDPQNQISETNEFNNTNYSAITITTGLPNLSISNPNATPSNLQNNTTITASCNVCNGGLSSSDASNLKIYLSDNTTWDAGDALLSTVAVDRISSGTYQSISQSVTVSVTGSIPQTKYLIFKSDADNTVIECSETDNTNYTQINITKPDLIIQNISTTPSSVQNASAITINGLVTNNGTVSAAASTLKAYLSDDCILDANDTPFYPYSYSIPLIAAGTSQNISNWAVYIPSSTTCTFPQSKYILLVSDANNVVAELNENNNTGCSAISIVSPTVPELSISSGSLSYNDGTNQVQNYALGEIPSYIYMAPSADYYGDVNFGATIKNNTCAALYNVKYRITTTETGSPNDIITVTDFTIPSISGNGEYNVTKSSWVPNAGSLWYYTVKFEIDPDNTIAESLENNNQIEITASIGWDKSAINSVNKLGNESMTIYPNPANDIISVNSSSLIKNIRVYNLTGQLISCSTPNSKNYTLNVFNLTPGLYLFSIESDQFSESKLINVVR